MCSSDLAEQTTPGTLREKGDRSGKTTPTGAGERDRDPAGRGFAGRGDEAVVRVASRLNCDKHTRLRSGGQDERAEDEAGSRRSIA